MVLRLLVILFIVLICSVGFIVVSIAIAHFLLCGFSSAYSVFVSLPASWLSFLGCVSHQVIVCGTAYSLSDLLRMSSAKFLISSLVRVLIAW